MCRFVRRFVRLEIVAVNTSLQDVIEPQGLGELSKENTKECNSNITEFCHPTLNSLSIQLAKRYISK